MDYFTKLATLNPLLAYLLILVFFLGCSLVLALATRRFTDYQTRMSHNDIAGFIFTTAGAIYAIFTGIYHGYRLGAV